MVCGVPPLKFAAAVEVEDGLRCFLNHALREDGGACGEIVLFDCRFDHVGCLFGVWVIGALACWEANMPKRKSPKTLLAAQR